MIDLSTTLMQRDDLALRPSGLYVPQKNKRDRPIAIDLFCGAGGFSLGFIEAGFEVVAAVEWDADAAITYLTNMGAYPINLVFVEPEDGERFERRLRDMYRRNGWLDEDSEITAPILAPSRDLDGPFVSGKYRPDDRPGVSTFFFGDVRKLTSERLLQETGLTVGEVDVVFGGPPCQGFSHAGKRNVMDPRNSLVFEFTRFVLDIRPRAFLMENVPGMLNMVTPEGWPLIDEISLTLEKGGFGTAEALKRSLLETAGVGAAMQGREKLSRSKRRTKKADEREDAAAAVQAAMPI